MLDTVLFDLDGTLLPMDIEEFTARYFGALQKAVASEYESVELIMKAIIYGTKAMYGNKEGRLNEEVFWSSFEEVCHISKKEIEPFFEKFYKEVFPLVGKDSVQSPNMIQAVKLLKEKGYKLYLTTNPLFPNMAVLERIRWAGLDPSDFEYITSYENSHACKPSTQYYEEVFAQCHIEKDNTMMVGNDTKEDGVIETLGIPLYIVKDYVIHRSDSEISTRWHGHSSDFLQFVKELPSLK